MDEIIKRRDRMIKAFQEMTSHTERRPGRRYGTCRTCGAMIEWVKTSSGKNMAQVPNMGEPHIPHCGKNNWTLERWSQHMQEIIELEHKVNNPPMITVPDEIGIRTLSPKEAKALLKEWAENLNTMNDVPW